MLGIMIAVGLNSMTVIALALLYLRHIWGGRRCRNCQARERDYRAVRDILQEVDELRQAGRSGPMVDIRDLRPVGTSVVAAAQHIAENVPTVMRPTRLVQYHDSETLYSEVGGYDP